jgi:hypothetical protein
MDHEVNQVEIWEICGESGDRRDISHFLGPKELAENLQHKGYFRSLSFSQNHHPTPTSAIAARTK